MRKVKLDIESLQVETFEVVSRRARRPGTVMGRMDAPAPFEEEEDTPAAAAAGALAGRIANGIVTNHTKSCIPWCLSVITCSFCSC